MSMIRNFFVTIVLFIRVCDKLLLRLLLLRPSADLVTSIMQSRRAITAGSSRIGSSTHAPDFIGLLYWRRGYYTTAASIGQIFRKGQLTLLCWRSVTHRPVVKVKSFNFDRPVSITRPVLHVDDEPALPGQDGGRCAHLWFTDAKLRARHERRPS
jgi:hypothetical protein